jgi:hypothetical protein
VLDVLVFGKHNFNSEIQNELPQRKAIGRIGGSWRFLKLK